MRNEKIGDKNPNYKYVDDTIIDTLIIEYKINKKITAEMVKKHGLSIYLITRILKNKGIYICQKTMK
jgi:hypothetical protein